MSEINSNGLTIVDYSESSIAVIGDTKPHKEDLKSLGGKWNSKLSCGPGWIFSAKLKNKVQDFVNTKGNKGKDNNESEEEEEEIKRLPSLLFNKPKQTSTSFCKQALFDEFVEYLRKENILISEADSCFFKFISTKKLKLKDYETINKTSFIELALCHI